MSNYKSINCRYLLGLGICMFIFSSCIEELIKTQELNGTLVISGQLSNSEKFREILVLNVIDNLGAGDSLDAEVSLYRDGQLWLDLDQMGPGRYRLPETARIEEGKAYFIEVLLDDETYRSQEQLVAPKASTDTISYRVLSEAEFIQENREATEPIVLKGIEFSAHINLPTINDGEVYYRWVVDEVWSFIESNKTDTCYVREAIETNTFSLLSNTDSDILTGDVKIPIMRQGLDKSFHYQHYINAYMHSIDKRTYEYYSQVKRLDGTSGTIYDEVPGPIEGNIRRLDNPNIKPSGFVEFFLADTFRLRLRRDFIPSNVPDQCWDIPGGGPCPPDPMVPCKCLECEAICGEDALTPPDYWVD
ncbi:MAG: DUF4249 family protein [Bacteroidota bacterium]